METKCNNNNNNLDSTSQEITLLTSCNSVELRSSKIHFTPNSNTVVMIIIINVERPEQPDRDVVKRCVSCTCNVRAFGNSISPKLSLFTRLMTSIILHDRGPTLLLPNAEYEIKISFGGQKQCL